MRLVRTIWFFLSKTGFMVRVRSPRRKCIVLKEWSSSFSTECSEMQRSSPWPWSICWTRCALRKSRRIRSNIFWKMLLIISRARSIWFGLYRYICWGTWRLVSKVLSWIRLNLKTWTTKKPAWMVLYCWCSGVSVNMSILTRSFSTTLQLLLSSMWSTLIKWFLSPFGNS